MPTSNYNGGFFPSSGCTGYTWAWSGQYGQEFTPIGGAGSWRPSWQLPGGTGSIYPGEYGEHSWDSNSGNEGYTLTVDYRDYQINSVALSDTFETWRAKTNSDIIGKLNKLKVYGATFGDGIMIANTTGGTLTIAFSGNVTRQNVTFCNDLNIGGELTVAGTSINVSAPTNSVTYGKNFNESLIILNTDEDPVVGCRHAGLIIGGSVTGPYYIDGTEVTALRDSPGGDIDNAFAFDRPYLLHKQGLWRTKEGLWLEGKLLHQEVFGGTGGEGNHAHVGSTSDAYPFGPYGYTGCTLDTDNIFFKNQAQGAGVSGGVVRLFFGPTLSNYNFLDIDGRGGRAGVTGTAWHDINTNETPTGGIANALVIGNTAGPLLDFDTDGYTNIYRGVNKKRIKKNNHGFMFGECVRYSGITNGYTYASAMGQFEPNDDFINAAEVVGIVSNIVSGDEFEMTISGEVRGTTAQWNSIITDDVSDGLVPGSVYFLSTSAGGNEGLIQKQQPNVAGYVSKPVLLALEEQDHNNERKQTALILHYRGQYLSPTGCTWGTASGINGASGDDATQFELPYAGDDDYSVGDWLSWNAKGSTTVFRKAYSTDEAAAHVIGVVTHVDTSSKYVRIATSGTIFFATDPAWQENVTTPGPIYLDETPGWASDLPRNAWTVKLGDMVNSTTLVMNIDAPNYSDPGMRSLSSRVRGAAIGIASPILGNSAGTGETFDTVRRVNKNELYNPDFSIWQRNVGLTTDSYGNDGWTMTNNTYFADRWLRISQTGTGPNTNNPYEGISGGTHRSYDYLLQRKKFQKSETQVPNHPNYYAAIKGKITYHGGTNSNEFYRVEQRLPDATSFAGEVMTASFWARSSGGIGDCHLAWIQNLTGTTGAVAGASGHRGEATIPDGRGLTANELIHPITDFALSTTWTNYAYSFFVPELSGVAGSSGANHFPLDGGITANHFASLAFYTQCTSTPNDRIKNIYFNHELHLANVKLERGDMVTPFSSINYNEELRKCWYFYQTSYEFGKYPGYNTMLSNRPDTSGVWFMVPGTAQYNYELPERMRINPSCTLWSPTGTKNEGFNVDVARDLSSTTSTKGSLGEVRKTNSNALSVNCGASTPNGMIIKVPYGSARLDTVVVHYEADSELNNALPTQVQ